MRSSTQKALLARNFPTDLIAKVEGHGHTVRLLDAMSKEHLRGFYSDDETDFIAEKIKRQPIPDDVVERVIDTADGVCCYCADGNSTRPFQIHHIHEYASSQDNDEDNLLLLCPTHHVSVPKAKTQEEQKRARREWHAVVAVAKAYRRAGLSFPYGRFVAVDYASPADPVAVIDDYRLTPATALLVTAGETADTAERRLTTAGFLVVAGGSGSGKTTLALGVAGRLVRRGRLVFSFRPPKLGTTRPIAEVLTFLHTADKPGVLILDDANIDFREEELTEVRAAAAGGQVSVVATWTRDGAADNSRFERHLPDWIHVSWEALRPGVRAFLLRNEAAVVGALAKYQSRHDVRSVGLGDLDTPLDVAMRRIEETAGSISEFLFLLRGGADVVRQHVESLVEAGRADAPVLYAAVEQIAGYERAVTPSETAAACGTPQTGERLPAATADWVTEVFEGERRRGRMQRLRGAYTTIHRDWARRLIGTALGLDRSRPVISAFLLRDFDLKTPDPMRLMILWSWLWYDEHGGPFVRDWIARQRKDEWTHLVGTAAKKGLGPLGAVSDRLHSIFLAEFQKPITAAAFAAHEAEVSRAVATAGPTDWYSLQDVLRAIDYACPEYAARVIKTWDPVRCAEILGETLPGYYDAAWWFFSGVKDHSPDWVAAVGQALSWEAISRQLTQARTGALEVVFKCEQLLSRLGVPLRRSMIRRYGEAATHVLRDAHLSEVHASPLDGLLFKVYFPQDIAPALAAMDPSRIAKELALGTPRDWMKFSSLGSLTLDEDSPWAADVIDALDVAQLVRSVESQGNGHELQIRSLLWGLGKAREPRRSELAERLYPQVLEACRRNGRESPNLLEALTYMSERHGGLLAGELGVKPAVEAIAERHENRRERATLVAGPRLELAEFDATGEDFDLTPLLQPVPPSGDEAEDIE